jgi:VWFA-related protein
MTRFLAFFIAWATAFGPASFSQGQVAQPHQSQTPENVIHVTVNLVQMDAVVTDSHGNPVDNLKPEDFEILQDGKPQKITNFSYISTRPAAPAPSNPPKPAPQTKGIPIPPARPITPPPFMPKASDIHRTIALVVDDPGLSFESIVRVRNSLKKYVDTQVQPGDLVAIVRTGAGMGSLQQFTTDKRLLYAAIDRIKYTIMSRVGIGSFEPLGSRDFAEVASGQASADGVLKGGGDPAIGARVIAQLRTSIFSVGTLGAIRYVVDGLRELPGRKAVVLFSESLQLFNGNDPDLRVAEGVRNLIDAANRASVVIYTIDPRGLNDYGLTAADAGADPTGQSSSQRAGQAFDSQAGLVMLAQQTGGIFYQNNNDILGQVEKAVEDADGYYLIAYHPPSDTFDAKTGQPKFRNVKVRVKTAGLTVRSRSGFLNHPDTVVEAPARTPAEQIRRALYSPFNSGAIHLRLSALFTNFASKGSFISGLLHFEAKDLHFNDQPDGSHKALIDVVAITFGEQGQGVDTSTRSFIVTLKGDEYQKALDDGLFFEFQHAVKKPGYYQLRVALRDEGSQQIGSANQFIEIPDVSKALTLSSLILEKETTATKRTAGEAGEGQSPQQDPKGNPALRIFKPGDSLDYVYQILNAGANSAKPIDLQVHTRLFRDGQQVYEGKPMPLQIVTQQDPRHLLATGTMKLGVQMPPGDYVLQVIVIDALSGDKHRTAAQSTDFEVQQ